MSSTVEKAAVSAVLLAFTVPVFFAAAALSIKHQPVPWLSTRWDAFIPFVPEAVWPYLSWYVAPWFLLAARQRDFRRVASAIALTFAICTLAYVSLPASIERPPVVEGTLSETALFLLYRHDPPWNIFPSFHAALCAILWRPPFGGRILRAIMPLWMSSICVACVLTKQHQILDILVGALVGSVALAVATMAFDRLDLSHVYARLSNRREAVKAAEEYGD
jgi:membrane-associated phospholipid phosphatase